MRLAAIDIRDYRSIFLDEAGKTLTLDLGAGMNTLVGLNNCGKSNVLRAISLALDPQHEFDGETDAPGPRAFALPVITLQFAADGDRPEEQAALAAADNFEQAVGTPAGGTFASRGLIALQVAFQRETAGYRRRELLLTPDGNVPTKADDFAALDDALAKLRSSVRFVLIKSGESIESILEGNFREILHSVVRERLDKEFKQAESSRQDYIAGLQESVLGPLRERLATQVGRLFPEITSTQLAPDVPSIERTLSRVGVSLGDLVVTPLDQKGTGVRGGVLVAMLSYLALNATRGMVFAVEEPEAFLHPSSQEDLRDALDELAAAGDVTLLVTTHSPYIVTRSPHGRVFCLAKDADGRTRVAQHAAGDAIHAPLIGGLFRETTFQELLTRATSLPDGAQAALLVEGDGDERCLRLAAGVVGRPDLLDGIHIRPTGGTTKMIVEAVLAKASLGKPVLVVVDNDEHGRDCLKTLTSQPFNFQKNSQIFTYVEAFSDHQALDPHYRSFPYEAEDLFDPALIQRFVDEHQPAIHEGSKKRADDAFHYDFGQAAKGELQAFLDRETQPADVRRWLELLLVIRQRLNLPVDDASVDDLITSAETLRQEKAAPTGTALILTNKLDFARYSTDSAIVLDPDHPLPGSPTHVGFYVERAIQPPIARILADYEGLHFSRSTVEQLRSTGRANDAHAADLVHASINADDDHHNTTRRLLLLSSPTASETFTLRQPIENTRQHNGRPVAWTAGPRPVSLAALVTHPATTDQLDAADRPAEASASEAPDPATAGSAP